MIQINKEATREFTATLPANGMGSPIKMLGHVNPMTVFGNGKVLAQLAPGETATFEVKPAPWWKFWDKSSKWARVV